METRFLTSMLTTPGSSITVVVTPTVSAMDPLGSQLVSMLTSRLRTKLTIMGLLTVLKCPWTPLVPKLMPPRLGTPLTT